VLRLDHDLGVALARRSGATGAWLTGAGWGGVVIILAPGRFANAVLERIQAGFARRFGRIPQVRKSRAGGGVRIER
jgi:galactokinase